MKTIIVSLATMGLMLCTALSSELRMDYSSGWSPSCTLKIDFVTGKMTLAQSTGEMLQGQLPNHTNVGIYVSGMLDMIAKIKPKDQIFGEDAPVYKIHFVDGNKQKDAVIGIVGVPGAIYLNEGYPAERELNEVRTFVKNAPSHVLVKVLNGIIETHLVKKTSKAQSLPTTIKP